MSEQQTELVQGKKITLNITTPRGEKFVEEADMLIMRCIDGDLGVLPRHEPVSAVLGEGILRIFNDNVEKKIAVFNGIVEIDGTNVNIFSTIAQRPDEIDLERAEQDRREAEAALEASEEVQMRSLQVVLRRSLVRIEVSLHLDDEDE
ncbi:MAG TPA: ATP synthase F1 subunit epsilon [Bacilli bacterium]|nr:ATP synthase F1 subunit epsilon [Bacilli bacterium]